MIEQGILFEDSGIVGIGPSGERLYGAKNFMALMSVFDTPSLFQVVCGIEELGWVHPLSFAGFGQKAVVISLGGRSWEVIRLDEDKSIAYVRAVEASGRSRWLGGSRALSRRLCDSIRSILLDDVVDQVWSKRAEAELSEARSETFAVRAGRLVVETDAHSGRIRWWTFGGLRANYSLALMLRTRDGVVPRFDNFSVEVPNARGLREVEETLKKLGRIPDTSSLVHTDPPGRVKFWDCLPVGLRQNFSTSRFTDSAGAVELLEVPRIHLDHPQKDGGGPA
jgi:ATP-dependent Lhr-like helicase